MLGSIQDISIEDIPDEFVDELELPNNGGNVISVWKDRTPFSMWLASIGFVFNMPEKEGVPKNWAWLVIFR